MLGLDSKARIHSPAAHQSTQRATSTLMQSCRRTALTPAVALLGKTRFAKLRPSTPETDLSTQSRIRARILLRHYHCCSWHGICESSSHMFPVSGARATGAAGRGQFTAQIPCSKWTCTSHVTPGVAGAHRSVMDPYDSGHQKAQQQLADPALARTSLPCPWVVCTTSAGKAEVCNYTGGCRHRPETGGAVYFPALVFGHWGRGRETTFGHFR